jgi:hypothetical protein
MDVTEGIGDSNAFRTPGKVPRPRSAPFRSPSAALPGGPSQRRPRTARLRVVDPRVRTNRRAALRLEQRTPKHR